jgi:hypothetical protein
MALSTRDVIVAAALAASCASPHAGPSVRFANAPPARVVDDRRDVPARPEVSPSYLQLDYFDRSFAGPVLRALKLPESHRARGVNALDEVPDSTWFTNRIGVRDLTPAEVGRGPIDDEGPEPYKPWTIQSTKSGTEVGFIITDAKGIQYGLAFDHPEWPELETGSAVVTNRLLHAFGYNVPADRIAYVRPEELRLAPDAKLVDQRGKRVGRLDRDELDRRLAKVWHMPDGRIRVVASRWLAGTSLGGTPPSGVRSGDPNDRIPHEDRRDLRGQYPLFAWLEHVDLIQANFLDLWIEDPVDPRRHYVVHYALDLGKSLGTMAVTDYFIRSGHNYAYDWYALGRALVMFGVAPRPWGHEFAPSLIGVSPTFVATGFAPGAWKPDIQYRPFQAADRFDAFWGTKVLARFTPAQIRAAVEAGQFSDPRTTEYLTNTLIARQHTIEAYWYARVNPLDRFAVTGGALCFEDLAVTAQLASASQTQYELASFDRAGRPLGGIRVGAAPNGTTCARSVKVALDGDGYTIVKLTTVRPAFGGSTLVHVAREPGTGAWRVIGVWRL